MDSSSSPLDLLGLGLATARLATASLDTSHLATTASPAEGSNASEEPSALGTGDESTSMPVTSDGVDQGKGDLLLPLEPWEALDAQAPPPPPLACDDVAPTPPELGPGS